ncbi:hypothetical protein DVW12_09895 [Clostridium botulinum]|nr:hypothetical protein [Clostridium botulinum]
MGSFKSTIITKQGHALMAKLIAGTVEMQFTKIRSSDKDYSTLTPSELEELSLIEDIRQEVVISEVKRINNASVKVSGVLTNTQLKEGYYLKTIALYANDPDEGEILYSVTPSIQFDWMPPNNGVTSSSVLIDLVTVVSNAENVTIDVDPNATATVTQLKELEVNMQKQINEVNSQLLEIDKKKSDVKKELLNTAVANNIFFKLEKNDIFTKLQGGCLSEDGLNFYCCLIKASEDDNVILLKYSTPDLSDFSTWEYVGKSDVLKLGHANDMCCYNGKIYITNANTYPTHIEVINPDTLIIEETKELKYGATAITYNSKIDMFVTRRKIEWQKFDYYDTNFNYIKTVENNITFDVVQGIDSDESYIYEPMYDNNFGCSFAVFDLNGNFIKRIGCNVIDEIEFIANYNNYYISGFYSDKGNYVALLSINTCRRLTASRYVLNSGRNTIVYSETPVFNGVIKLKYPIKYYSHLSIYLSVDGIETESRLIDLTEGSTSHIINTFRITSEGNIIFYRSYMEISYSYSTITIVPFAKYQINSDGTKYVSLYSSSPESFTSANSISFSKISGQILCGQRI